MIDLLNFTDSGFANFHIQVDHEKQTHEVQLQWSSAYFEKVFDLA